MTEFPRTHRGLQNEEEVGRKTSEHAAPAQVNQLQQDT